MKHIQKIICIAVFFTMAFACSTKKDSVINRNYHVLTTKFNVLFNGKEAFKIGLKAINETYEDNFWKQLPIEPLSFKEEALVASKPNKSQFSGFDAAPTKKERIITKLTEFIPTFSISNTSCFLKTLHFSGLLMTFFIILK